MCRDACLLLYLAAVQRRRRPAQYALAPVPVGRSVARSGPHQRERRSWPSAGEGTGVADRWPLSRMARLRAASFDKSRLIHNTAASSAIEKPSVHSSCRVCTGCLEAIRFVADSGQRPGRLDSGVGSGIAGVDARSFASSPACSSHKGLRSSSRCWIPARRACEICQSKKMSVIGRSFHCTVHPEIMSGDMDSGQVTFLSRGWPELVWLVPVMSRPVISASPIASTVMGVCSARQRQDRERATWREPLP